MTLTVTNSRTGEREEFTPQNPDNVLLYYCGLTVSDYPHLGHARSWIHVDVMRNWLEQLGYTVRHVENFTDVNEKIVARIGEYGDSEVEVARHFITTVIRDMRSLNLQRAHVYPRVSEHIPEIIELIEQLLEKDVAYEANGSVYFDVSSFENYGKLSNQQLDEIEFQGDPDEQAEKQHPADFALWKKGPVTPADANEHRHDDLDPLTEPAGQTWSSPWSEGRPGWHIECSAMSMTHLDDHIDIHVGGQDLIFPHHENEIAQSEAATGERFAEYWFHVRLLETEGEKMSSSLKNFFTIHNAVEEFGPNPIRMFLLSTQYTQRQAYTEAALHEAVERWERLARAYDRAIEHADSPDAYTKATDDGLREAVWASREEFRTAMNNDFNTREGIRALSNLATAVNRHLDHHTRFDYQGLHDAIEVFDEFAVGVLGFEFGGTQAADSGLVDELLELILALREDERKAGNYEQADMLRDQLENIGVTIEDTESGVAYDY